MALQTAPLGQLPSMNMPYSIPTYEKPPSIWEKALAAFLVNAAGTAAGQVGENITARDYAKDFGEEPAGFGSKIVGGPRVSARQADQRESQKFQKESQMRDIGAAANVARFNATQAANRQAADIERDVTREGMAYDRQTAEGEQRLRLADAETAAKIKAARLQAELEAILSARDPKNLAMADYYKANAEESRATATSRNILNNLYRGNPTGAATGASPRPVLSDADRRAMQTARGQAAPSQGLPTDVPLSEFLGQMGETPVGVAGGYITGATPVADALSELMSRFQGGVELNQPATQGQPAMAGPLSNYDPAMDPLLTWLSDLLRNPPGSTPAR